MREIIFYRIKVDLVLYILQTLDELRNISYIQNDLLYQIASPLPDVLDLFNGKLVIPGIFI